ncbi:hypothetical protein WJX72_010893 [[Myrmecia] bisecta]|uniref:Cytochrome b561 domain-containing protein n=1 Tax=[Myrmecia] bisecta TaxID=41462 RepID=A0AAW1RAI8_9CHLO
MSEGVLAALKFRPLEGQARVRAIQVHALLQIVATLCIAGGFYAIAQHKNNLGKQHFKSIHAKMGLLTLILSVCAPLGGALSFKYLGLLTKIPERLQPTVKLAHRNLGIATLTVALITIEIILPHHAVWQRVPSKPAAPLGGRKADADV